ncbi:GTPase activating protein (Evi5) [Sporothrix schenckii 1099-18]|uniref:GTPase activating protein (Evi5) n=1 Tax=Sporothrix schenckii 1099-18 TaxID=1397361 RepID=A0A0F2MC76_SPOSC|nr:GTPase activating protein (Evi5) [Sporothrix schenckii 1099-18]KJR87308.1 GTPase activating protein (Evi5) [Sporothrix schenckii 1099-18]
MDADTAAGDRTSTPETKHDLEVAVRSEHSVPDVTPEAVQKVESEEHEEEEAPNATVAQNVSASTASAPSDSTDASPTDSDDTDDADSADDTQHEPTSPLIPGKPAEELDDEMVTTESASEDHTAPGVAPRLDEHDSLVTVRLSEPPVLSINTHSTASGASTGAAAEDARPSTPTMARSQRATMPTVAENESDSDDSSEDDEDVNWEQLQQTENEESNGQNSDNTAMLLARLEQENAKLATNPKSIRVQVRDSAQQSPRRVRPVSVAQLRDMVQGPTPAALRYSMLPPPPMTDLEFYAALVQDYHQTAARLPTLLSNKIRKGIPPPLRGVVWQGMTGATRDAALLDQYERFCDATSPYEGIIGKDLGRSFPGVDMFREPDGDGQRMLGRVLKSYSLHEPRIGYCQGLAFLVGPLLMHMPDREAFCVLVKLMENYDLRSSYMPDLAGLHVRIYQFRELLRSTLPELSSHLEDLQVDPAAYVSQWFLSFFAVTCPLPMLFRMYDVVFAEGAAETIMRVALSLMQNNQARLLACAELEDAIQLLLSRGLWDCYHYNADEFVLHFLSLSNVVSRDRLASLDQAYREAQIANINNQTDASSNADRASIISTIASRFLGRLWTSSSSSSSTPVAITAAAAAASNPPPSIDESPSLSNSTNDLASSSGLASPTSALSPLTQPLTLNAGLSAPPLRPLSFLQRSSSKHSIASTVNSMEAASPAAGPSSSATSSSSSSVLSSTSTDATSLSRDSSSDITASAKNASTSNSANNKNSDNDRYLHSQIEDLLTALSDLQRQHALTTDQLQREREERSDDQKAVQTLLRNLREKSTKKTVAGPIKKAPVTFGVQLRTTELDDTPVASKSTTATQSSDIELSMPQDELFALLEPVEARFSAKVDNRRSSVPQTKSQLRDELGRAKEQLVNELAKGQDRNRQVNEMEQELATMKDQLRDSHARARVLHQDKQRLERQIHDLRTRVASEAASAAVAAAAGAARITHSNGADLSSSSGAESTGAQGIADAATEWFGRATGTGAGGGTPSKAGASGGLRELKLGRSKSTPTQASGPAATGPPPATNALSMFGGNGKRSSSLIVRGTGRRESVFGGGMGSYQSGNEDSMEQQQDALVLELVQAKTSEAVARQEAEEAKQKLESLRKALGLSANDMASMLHNARNSGGGAAAATAATAASTAASAAMGVLGRLTTSMSESNAHATSTKAVAATAPAAAPATNTTSSSGYGFFGWRR